MPTKYPPMLSLGEAVNVIKAMYAEHQSREISIDLMPVILKAKPTSSGFPMRISALQRFGFVDKRPNDLLWLTDLAMQIISPIGQNEALEAKANAFKKIDVLNELLLKYPNGKLPSPEQLQQTLLKTYQIERDRVKQWYDFIVDSFRALPELGGMSTISPSPLQSPQSPAIPIVETRTTKSYVLPLPSGKTFQFNIDEGYTTDDMDFVIAFFDLMQKKTK